MSEKSAIVRSGYLPEASQDLGRITRQKTSWSPLKQHENPAMADRCPFSAKKPGYRIPGAWDGIVQLRVVAMRNRHGTAGWRDSDSMATPCTAAPAKITVLWRLSASQSDCLA